MTEYPFFDRDLSWLSFNYRVLLEAQNDKVPLLERLRFLAIYSSNLDEFFRVRVASLRRLNEINKKKIEEKLKFNPGETLSAIHDKVESQLIEYGETLNQLRIQLKEEGVDIHFGGIKDEHKQEIQRYFKTKVLAYLQPQNVNPEHPFIKNRSLYFALRIEIDGIEKYNILNIPSEDLHRFYSVKDGDKITYYFLDDIIRENINTIYPKAVVHECVSLKLNKDADLQIDDEFSGNLVEKIEKQIKKRDLGVPTRFLIDENMSVTMLNMFKDLYGLSDDDVSHGGRYHNLNDFFQLGNPTHLDIEYPSLSAIRNKKLDRFDCIFDAIENEDQILHFPYQSYEYVLQFFNEASIHPEVTEINVTFYRMAKNSLIGEALLSAAKNGKKVNVFMEVKARFDEENNLHWANRMQAAGINIVYSMPGLKVHAKVALVRRENESGIKHYGFFGTGNLNESTAKVYCDHGLLTSNVGMTGELNQVFQFLLTNKEPDSFEHLVVSQFGAMETFKDLIDREIKLAESGHESRIVVKVNNLEEPKLIKKLYEAASKGVKVEIISRSICCLVPDTNGIEVTRIVDRYLEHARIFYFHNEGNPRVFMGSSDWMKRNLRRRIEVTFPIYDPVIKQQIIDILDIQLGDFEKRVRLNSDLENIFFTENEFEAKSGAQRKTYDLIMLDQGS